MDIYYKRFSTLELGKLDYLTIREVMAITANLACNNPTIHSQCIAVLSKCISLIDIEYWQATFCDFKKKMSNIANTELIGLWLQRLEVAIFNCIACEGCTNHCPCRDRTDKGFPKLEMIINEYNMSKTDINYCIWNSAWLENKLDGGGNEIIKLIENTSFIDEDKFEECKGQPVLDESEYGIDFGY